MSCGRRIYRLTGTEKRYTQQEKQATRLKKSGKMKKRKKRKAEWTIKRTRSTCRGAIMIGGLPHTHARILFGAYRPFAVAAAVYMCIYTFISLSSRTVRRACLKVRAPPFLAWLVIMK